MAPTSLLKKIEELIITTLQESSPMAEEELIRIIVKKYGNGDITNSISQVIEYMEQCKYTLVRTFNTNALELSTRKNRR